MPTYHVPVLERFSFQPPVIDKDLTSPPINPQKGDRYLIFTSNPSGAWTGYGKHITVYNGTSWEFIQPSSGMLVYIVDENKFYLYSANNWSELTVGGSSSCYWNQIINLDNQSSDYLLQPFQIGIRTYQNAQTIPLKVATVSPSVYEVFFINTAPFGSNLEIQYLAYLFPNNIAYSNEMRVSLGYRDWTGGLWHNFTATGLCLGLGGGGDAFMIIKNYNTLRTSTGFSSYHQSSSNSMRPAIIILHSIWMNTTTPWTSLGSLVYGGTGYSGIVLIRRIS